eukprot:9094264-Pyramimonas_sp.AAC.1
MDAGLDSLGAVEVKNAIESIAGVELPVTAIFDYPTIGAVTKYLHSQMAPPDDVEHSHDGDDTSAVALHSTS